MNQLHNQHKWHKASPDEPKLFFHQYFLDDNEFPGWKLIKKANTSSPDVHVENYIFSHESDPMQVFNVQIAEGQTRKHAKDHFQNVLRGHMRPLRDSVRGILGPDSYVNHSDEIHSGIFALANVVVRVSTVGKVNIACNEFIRKIYSELRNIREDARKTTGPAGNDINFSAAVRNPIRKGQRTELILGMRAWYKFVLHGPGEISARNNNLEFLSSEKGTATITLFTYKENSVEKDTLTIIVE
jgi:hypothetical protein